MKTPTPVSPYGFSRKSMAASLRRSRRHGDKGMIATLRNELRRWRERKGF